jgi:hypothetical protein
MGDDKHGQLQLNQLSQMTVHGAIAAEDQNRVSFVCAAGQAEPPSGLRVPDEWLQMFGRRTQPKNGGSSHWPPEINKIWSHET